MADLGKSRPYRKMATSCRTRVPHEKRVTWTKIESEPFRNGKYQVRPLRRELIQSAAELWCAAYPELSGSPHEFLLDPEQYEMLVALEDRWEQDSANKVYCMTVVEKLEAREVISATLLTKFEKNLQIEYSFAATHPEYKIGRASCRERV